MRGDECGATAKIVEWSTETGRRQATTRDGANFNCFFLLLTHTHTKSRTHTVPTLHVTMTTQTRHCVCVRGVCVCLLKKKVKWNNARRRVRSDSKITERLTETGRRQATTRDGANFIFFFFSFTHTHTKSRTRIAPSLYVTMTTQTRHCVCVWGVCVCLFIAPRAPEPRRGDARGGGHPEFNRRTKRLSDCRHPECRPLDRLFLAVKGDKRIFSFSWRATGGQTDLFQGGQTDLFIFMAGHPPKGWGRDRTCRLKQNMLCANRFADVIT